MGWKETCILGVWFSTIYTFRLLVLLSVPKVDLLGVCKPNFFHNSRILIEFFILEILEAKEIWYCIRRLTFERSAILSVTSCIFTTTV